jgi:NADH-quinone oxidoreductase subunit L
LRKYLPITYLTMLIGAFANAGLPPFAGFFSKDTIIEAVHASQVPGAGFAYLATLFGVFVGGFYSFRLIFYAFHGAERFADPHHPDVKELEAERAAERAAQAHDAHQKNGSHDEHGHAHAPHESPAVVTVPLILLAIPSVCAGWVIGTFLYGNFFGDAIYFSPRHPVMAELAKDFHGVIPMMGHGLTALPFWLATAGLVTAWYLYIARPELPSRLRRKAGVLVTILMEKYGFDRFNDWFFAGGARLIGGGLWKGGDVAVIDGFINGTARAVGWCAAVIRNLQSGFIYHYAFAMIIGILVLLTMVFL